MTCLGGVGGLCFHLLSPGTLRSRQSHQVPSSVLHWHVCMAWGTPTSPRGRQDSLHTHSAGASADCCVACAENIRHSHRARGRFLAAGEQSDGVQPLPCLHRASLGQDVLQHGLDGCPPLPSCRLCPGYVLVPQHPRAPSSTVPQELRPGDGAVCWGRQSTLWPFCPTAVLPAPARAPAGSTWLCRGCSCRGQAPAPSVLAASAGRGAATATSPWRCRHPRLFHCQLCRACPAEPRHGAGTPQLGRSAAPSAALTAALPRGPAVSSK